MCSALGGTRKEPDSRKPSIRTDFDILDENIRFCDEKTIRFLKMLIIDHEFFYQQQVTVDGISIIILPFPVLKIRNLVCNAVVPSQN